MTDKEQIKRISKLLNELSLDDITSTEFDEMFPKQSINDIKDELWRMYCFVSDVCDTINMGDTWEQEPKTGHWEWVQYDSNPNIGNWHCSECRCVVVECVGKEGKGGIPLYKYCPQCGAKMESEET